MAKHNKTLTPAQAHRIGAKLLELSENILTAQRQYRLAHNNVYKLALEAETKRLALESLQSQYVIEPGTARDFEIYEKARRKLVRTESAYTKADEQFKTSQAAYDKKKGPKNMKNLQLAREQIEKLQPKIIKDSLECYSATESLSAVVNSTRATNQLETAIKAYKLAVDKYQMALPKLQRASSELQKAWGEHDKHVQSLRRKKLPL